MAPVRLSLACWDYDRVKAIEDGRVRPEGIELTFLNLRVEETFFRQLRYQEFDVSEMSLSSYVLTLNSPSPPFLALPVFPSRMFRHQSIYVNLKAGIKSPADLAGRRIGTPEFQMTAPVWQRGTLEDEYGVKYDSPEYFTGNVEPSAVERTEKVPLKLADSVRIQPIPKGKCLAQMLADGEIDALESATAPSTFGTHPDVGRLFPNAKEVEQEYFMRTGIFPIMHVIAVKRSVLEAHPWVARSLTKAFAGALDYAYDAIHERAALRYILPWMQFHVEETQAALCADGNEKWWQDGLTPQNTRTLEKFLEASNFSHSPCVPFAEAKPEMAGSIPSSKVWRRKSGRSRSYLRQGRWMPLFFEFHFQFMSASCESIVEIPIPVKLPKFNESPSIRVIDFHLFQIPSPNSFWDQQQLNTTLDP